MSDAKKHFQQRAETLDSGGLEARGRTPWEKTLYQALIDLNKGLAMMAGELRVMQEKLDNLSRDVDNLAAQS